MTEKRFTYIKNSSISQYQSIPIQKIGKGKPFHCQGIVDELNKLWNENEELKSEIQKLKKENRLLEIEDENFKDCLIEFNKTKQNFNEIKEQFVYDVYDFMENKGILVRVLFFGDTFGLDIKRNWDNMTNSPRKIPLNVLTEFCNTFGCEFEYTKCGGSRYIFSFDGLNMEY